MNIGVIIMEGECIRCQKNKKIYAKCLCKYCYNHTKYGDKHKEYVERWKKKNPDYFKNYYLNNKANNNE